MMDESKEAKRNANKCEKNQHHVRENNQRTLSLVGLADVKENCSDCQIKCDLLLCICPRTEKKEFPTPPQPSLRTSLPLIDSNLRSLLFEKVQEKEAILSTFARIDPEKVR